MSSRSYHIKDAALQQNSFRYVELERKCHSQQAGQICILLGLFYVPGILYPIERGWATFFFSRGLRWNMWKGHKLGCTHTHRLSQCPLLMFLSLPLCAVDFLHDILESRQKHNIRFGFFLHIFHNSCSVVSRRLIVTVGAEVRHSRCERKHKAN